MEKEKKMSKRPPHMEPMDVTSIKNKYLDISYASLSEAQKLDIYLPEGQQGPFPVILYVHGGAFMMGDKREGSLAAILEGLNHGYAIISTNYRLSQEALFPAATEDVKAAIRFIKANAQKYNLNPLKIAVWGGSAGGHLAAMMGTTSHLSIFDNPSLGHIDQSSTIQAVVDWFGPIDFLSMDEQFSMLSIEPRLGKTNDVNSPESKYIGQLITEAKELVEKSNPMTYIHESNPPFFIQHGTCDRNIPYLQSQQFAQKLSKVIGADNVYFELLEGASHGDEMQGAKKSFTTHENLEKIFNFLDSVLK